VRLELDGSFVTDGEADDLNRRRRAAMACFLSLGDGWKDARGALRGAFATALESDPRLRAEKEE
jgi:hypothetical protein